MELIIKNDWAGRAVEIYNQNTKDILAINILGFNAILESMIVLENNIRLVNSFLLKIFKHNSSTSALNFSILYCKEKSAKKAFDFI